MAKTVFKNQTFYYLLLAFIVLLLAYNIFESVKGENVYGLLPIAIQGTLLFLILSKAEYARLFILIWAIGFVLIGTSLQIIGGLMADFTGTFSSTNIYGFIEKLITIIISMLIITYTQSTVVVVESNYIEEKMSVDE